MNIRRIALILTFTVFSALPARAAVWETRTQWTPEWEERYTQWVRANVAVDIFERPGTPYQGLKVDCADAVYSMRAIFAFENGLPFAMGDSTGGPNVISNQMSRWDTQPDGAKRFRSFLQYIYGVTGTVTLPRDTYPVATTREAIGPGSLLLTDKKSHHSWTVKDVDALGIPHLVYSSRPAKTHILERKGFPTMAFLFPMGVKEERHAGFRRFRLPEQLGLPVWKVPGYSKEQYQIPAAAWRDEMQDRLSVRRETHEERLERVVSNLCLESTDRIAVVADGVAFNASIGTRCMNAQEYDDWSTPNRDSRLKGAFEDLDEAWRRAKNAGAVASLPPALLAKLAAAIPEAAAQSGAPANGYCTVTWAPGKTLTLGQLRRRSYDGLLSNNPHDPIEMRWGETKGPSKKAKSCPKY